MRSDYERHTVPDYGGCHESGRAKHLLDSLLVGTAAIILLFVVVAPRVVAEGAFRLVRLVLK
jgi:hypothetical protein